MQVRQATIEDVSAVYDALDALRQESIWGEMGVEMIPPYVRSQLLMVIHDSRQRLVVAESDGEILGIGGAELQTHRFLPGLTYVWEWALYVQPSCRHLGVGKALWGHLVAWGKQRGAFGAVYGKLMMSARGKAKEELIWHVFEREPVYA